MEQPHITTLDLSCNSIAPAGLRYLFKFDAQHLKKLDHPHRAWQEHGTLLVHFIRPPPDDEGPHVRAKGASATASASDALSRAGSHREGCALCASLEASPLMDDAEDNGPAAGQYSFDVDG